MAHVGGRTSGRLSFRRTDRVTNMNMYIPQSDDWDHESQAEADIIDFEWASAQQQIRGIELQIIDPEEIDIDC